MNKKTHLLFRFAQNQIVKSWYFRTDIFHSQNKEPVFAELGIYQIFNTASGR